MPRSVIMEYQTLKVSLDARGVLFVSINRPDIRNAFNEQMIAELTEVFEKKVHDPLIKVVVFGGEGNVFSGGGDLNWMKKSIEWNHAQNLEDTKRLTHMFSKMNECPKPLIGAVHGASIGGGVGFVAVCDIVVAVKDTQFSLSEVRLGIVPACIGPFVISKIGVTHARALFISADRFQAKKAYEIGLIHEIVEDRAELQTAVERYLSNILQGGPNALKIAKNLVLDLGWPERREKIGDCLQYVAKVLADLRVTPEAQEGLKAFLEKRKPAWAPDVGLPKVKSLK